MISFEKVIVEDFMSIEYLEFDFTLGVNAFVGENGAGKTQTLIALLQGLYNKNPKSDNDTIDETYNKITGNPYTITIYFRKGENNYIIKNDRKANSITIMENGKDVSPKGIKNQLIKIENIVGMNYKVFSAFYYLSTTTIKNVFDISNSENLVYRFFDIDTIKALDKFLKTKNKEFKKEYQLLMTTLQSIDKQLRTISDFDIEDKNTLINKKLILQESLLNTQNSSDVQKITLFETQLATLNEKIAEVKNELASFSNTKTFIKKQLAQLRSGVCPVCGSNVTSNISNLHNELDVIVGEEIKLKKRQSELETQKQKLMEKYKELKDAYTKKENEIIRELQMVEDKLIAYENNKDKYERIKENIEELKREREITLTRIERLKLDLSVISVGLSIIKSNAITKEYLNSFIMLLNSKIKSLLEYTDFHIDIIVYETKGKILFKFLDNGAEKTLNGLSSGEKTRVALIVLFSILETLQILSQNKLNLIVLDELLGVLDFKGIEMLKHLLNRYREHMALYIVLHHNEIKEDYFDNVYEVIKESEITNVYKKDLK